MVEKDVVYYSDHRTIQGKDVQALRFVCPRLCSGVSGCLYARLTGTGRDEKSKQLIIDIRGTLALKPGSPSKYDYEYKRNGTRNIFVAVEPLAGKRTMKVTCTRKKSDFAHFVKELVDDDYPQAQKIKLVLDNLNTHFPSSFYETFSKQEADRILDKIEFYYTPKHGSWLNMAEIEINMMDRECLARRIGEAEKLETEIHCWSRKRNEAKKKIQWSFTRQDADHKLSKHYVS